jgi:hypothetical protein
VRGFAEKLLLDQLGKALDRIDRRAQFVQHLPQPIGAAIGHIVVGGRPDAVSAPAA